MKLAEKYANGELDEAEEKQLEEAKKEEKKEEQKKEDKKDSKKKASAKKTKTGSFIAGVLKFLIWVGIICGGSIMAGAWAISQVGKVAGVMVKGLKDVNSRLSESLELECADDAQALEEMDADVLDAEGNPASDDSQGAMIHQGKSIAEWAKLFKGEFTIPQLARMATSGTDLDQLLLTTEGTSDIYDSELEEADYREKASHLLDPVGVKASTASLKAQDTAMISVVETLLKKIDRLEEKVDSKKKDDKLTESVDTEKSADADEQLEEAAYDLSNVDKSVAHVLRDHMQDFRPEILKTQENAANVVEKWLADAGVDTPYSRRMLAQIRQLPKFRQVGTIIQYLVNVYLAGCGMASTTA